MRRFYLYRSNLIPLEYYHKYSDLETFEEKCHDYYLLLPLWLLKKNFFDEVIIWRLTKGYKPDIIFTINGKKFIQRWVQNFNQVANYPSPDISFFRGGFKEYDKFTSKFPKFSKLKLYLGAGRRVTPQWGGKYDVYLMEDERDFIKGIRCAPFYKTASSNIFYPIKDSKIEYDICWPANFSQKLHKGQEHFIKLISSHPGLNRLKIVHCGNKPVIGERLCKKYNVNNIKFMGWVDRPSFNKLLNKSKCGLNLSNLQDGCPRVSTEILMSGTPLILGDTVRLLKDYRKHGVINVNSGSAAVRIVEGITNHKKYKKEVMNVIKGDLSFDNVNKKNIDLWRSL